MVMFALAAAPVALASSLCNGITGNLIQNCGFEANGAPQAYPTDWTTNAAYVTQAGNYNQVEDFQVNSGSFSLQFGNGDGGPLAGISQTFADTAGDSYAAIFYVFFSGCCSDPSAFLQALLDGNQQVGLNSTNAPAAWTQSQFTFTGSGSDTIAFQAQTNPGEWYLDDISVVDTSAGAPEPASALLLAVGLAAIGLVGRSRLRACLHD
jgi:hypothetical protein